MTETDVTIEVSVLSGVQASIASASLQVDFEEAQKGALALVMHSQIDYFWCMSVHYVRY